MTSARLPGSHTLCRWRRPGGRSDAHAHALRHLRKTFPDASGDMAGAPAAEGGEGGVRRGRRKDRAGRWGTSTAGDMDASGRDGRREARAAR